ncbi:MAG: hypothetical protein GXO62_01685 [Epsilonproteobacteria bacterium]|nr:hypothetical protein [Campylobacterota bacterium]
MKILIFLISVLFAYEAKVQPYEIYQIKSKASGSVVYANEELEGREINNTKVIQLDIIDDNITLNNLKKQMQLLKEQISLQKSVVEKKYSTYQKYLHLRTKSAQEKNLKYYDYAAAKSQLITLKSNLSNLEANYLKTKDIINKKNIILSGYLYKLYVKKGSFVGMGAPVADIADISKQKLIIYIPVNKTDIPKSLKIKGHIFKVTKIWKIPDSKYITSYKVELVGSGLKIGEIVKVEF